MSSQRLFGCFVLFWKLYLVIHVSAAVQRFLDRFDISGLRRFVQLSVRLRRGDVSEFVSLGIASNLFSSRPSSLGVFLSFLFSVPLVSPRKVTAVALWGGVFVGCFWVVFFFVSEVWLCSCSDFLSFPNTSLFLVRVEVD